MIDIQCYNRQQEYSAQKLFPVIRETAEHVLFSSRFAQSLMEHGIGVSVEVTAVGPRTMRTINREQRGVDALTDVLSFPARRMRAGEPEEPLEPWETGRQEDGLPLPFSLGDLVIAPARVRTQSEELGHSFERELMFLVIHGMLHLLGYDHEQPEDASVMEALQCRFVSALESVPCGFVALCGRPNVGKSTLINRLSGRTLAIETSKPQTTRHAIRSVLNTEDSQMAFLDMPGIHKPKNALGRAMMKTAMQSIHQADVVALMIDAEWRPFIGEEERLVIETARKDEKKILLLINKVDHAAKENILPLIALYDRAYHLDAYVPVSAKTGDGVDILLEEIKRFLPVRRRLFQIDDETDQTERTLASELIRKEILLQTEKEIPYGVAVMIDRFEEETDDGGGRRGVAIDAVILCERETHKKVLVGHGGAMIRAIGTQARKAMEDMLDTHVYLSLFVKVRPNWQNRPQNLGAAGLLPSGETP